MWEAGGRSEDVTNNLMELTAIFRLLSAAPASRSLLIKTDSRYCIDALTKWHYGWRKNNWRKGDGKPVLNADLLKSILDLTSVRKVEFEWVAGHAGILGNEKADTKARGCAQRSKDSGEDVLFSGPDMQSLTSP